jgi:competence protein ComFC
MFSAKNTASTRLKLLSKRVGKRLKLPYQGILLVKKRPRPAKHLLPERERFEAIRGVFATRPGSQVDNKRVLLVDDVMATDATLDPCAKALRDAGATEVSCFTVARKLFRTRIESTGLA